MRILLIVLGLIEFFAGMAALLGTTSSMYQLIGAIFVGFGVLTFGSAAMLEELTNIRRSLERPIDRREDTPGFEPAWLRK